MSIPKEPFEIAMNVTLQYYLANFMNFMKFSLTILNPGMATFQRFYHMILEFSMVPNRTWESGFTKHFVAVRKKYLEQVPRQHGQEHCSVCVTQNSAHLKLAEKWPVIFC